MEKFVVKKSAWKVVNFWSIVLCILIIPIIVLVFEILAAKKETITFYEDKIVVEKGFLSRSESSFVFAGVFSVNIKQSLWGRIFNYGDLSVDFVGKNDINTTYIKNPKAVKQFLESKIVKKASVQTHMY